MECRGQDVLYVEKQVLVSDIPSIEISENVCHTEETDGGCTIILPRNESGDILFPLETNVIYAELCIEEFEILVCF